MTRQYLIIFLIILSFATAYGQTKNVSCNCPNNTFAGTKAETTFTLSNGKTIVLCGYKNPDTKPQTYSEFVLAVCGQETIIDFWGAMLTCNLKVSKDTLLVEQLVNLPTAKDLKFRETVWIIEKIYFDRQKMIRKVGINRQIRKYNQQEIQAVLKAYNTAKPILDEGKMEIANKLFIATISGDKKSRQCFIEFKNKFGTLDGAYAEEYSHLTAMLKLWDNNK